MTNKAFFCRGVGKVSHSELPVTLLESVREDYSEVAVAYTHTRTRVNSPPDHLNTLTCSFDIWHPCVILFVKQREQKGRGRGEKPRYSDLHFAASPQNLLTDSTHRTQSLNQRVFFISQASEVRCREAMCEYRNISGYRSSLLRL